MRGKNFILTILVFLFISILGFAVENPNSLTPESVMEALNPDFVEGIKEYKPNLENIDKVFNYIEKNIKQKGRAIFYGKLDQEKKELIVTDENNKIIYIEKLPEKFVNSIPYFEVKQTYSLKNGKTLNYSEMNTEMLEKKVKMKSETLMKTKMNKKDAIKILKLAPDLSTSTNNVFSNIEYSKFEVYDTNNNLLQRTYYKNKKMVIEQEIEGDKVKMITYFDNLNTMNGKMEAYVNDTLVSSMQIKNLLPEGESKIFYPSGKILTVTNVKNGTMDGTMKVFYENGKIRMIGHFKDGKKDGEFIEYEEDGTIIDKILYKNDEMVSQ
ncbi:toxin-antitoxin system YwqK family antitoxin [Fusobacterium periodonticum]|uniref:toxin-antitoxin system YwqK family antitoxin n=1 Tax=Fusobacterium periodonticum TaxID=860 RepID=UPI00352F4BBF